MRTLDLLEGRDVPGRVVATLGAVDVARGRQDLYALQRRATLDRLGRVARIQSTEASNAIEGIQAPLPRIRALMGERASPENRSEEEIAGYRDVLDTINRSWRDIAFTPSVVLQLHRDLFAFTSQRAGAWKAVDNRITQVDPDGAVAVRLETVPAWQTPRAMEDLHAAFARVRDLATVHPVLAVGGFVLDFLVIHPFLDGNGRMSRLLTLLALYQAGYGVGRYVSLERLIDETRDSYYDSLSASSAGWHEGQHDPWPWLGYFAGVLLKACEEFEAKAADAPPRGIKSEAVRQFVDARLEETFALRDVQRAVPDVSQGQIRIVLRTMRGEGLIELEGTGRGARYRRVAG